MGKRGRPPHPDILTPREWQVLALLREGFTNEQIAHRLDISYATAKYHVAEIISKLGVQTREEAAAWQPPAAPARWSQRGIAWLPRRAWPLAGAVGAAAALAVVLAVLALPKSEPDSSNEAVASQTAAASVAIATPLASSVPTTSSPEALPYLANSIQCELASPLASSGVAVINRDGSGFLDLAQGYSPAWSPDGSVIAFVGALGVGGGAEMPICLIGPDGAGTRAVSAAAWDDVEFACEGGASAFSWSPDGKRIVHGDGVSYRITLASVLDGSRQILLDGYGPAWSPDASRVAYTAATGGQTSDCHVRLAELADGGPVVHDLTVGLSPVWSPDARQIAFLRGGTEPWVYDIFVMVSDGTGIRQLTYSSSEGLGYRLTAGAWSPDSTKMALTRSPLANSSDPTTSWQSQEIVIIDVSTGESTRLVTGSDPIWSPDGSQLAYLVWDTTDAPYTVTSYIYLVDSSGTGDPIFLAPGQYPSWSPDSSRLAFMRITR